MSVFVPLDVSITADRVGMSGECVYIVGITYVYSLSYEHGVAIGIRDIWESDPIKSLNDAFALKYEIQKYIKAMKQWP